jgi:hypothetical protein
MHAVIPAAMAPLSAWCCLGLQVFLDSSMPIIKHYEQRGKVRKIHADRPPEQVYQDVRPFLIAMQTADSVVS